MATRPPDLNLDLARALIEWHRAGGRRGITAGGGQLLTRPVPPGPVLDHLLECLPVESWLPGEGGWCVIDADLRFEMHRVHSFLERLARDGVSAAQAILDGKEKEEAEEAGGVAFPQDGEPVEDRVPPADSVPWQVFDAEAIRLALNNPDSKDRRRPLLKELAKRPGRWLPKATSVHVDAVEGLRVHFPNLAPAIDRITEQLSLQALCGGALRLPPMLLLGAPGAGKTAFAERLAEALNAMLAFHSLAEMTAGFLLTGMSASWAHPEAGIVTKAIRELPDGQPLVVVLDELDKARRDGVSPTDSALLGMLDPASASHFRDEFLNLALDLSPVSFLCTANRTSNIRPELLSRLIKVEIPQPGTSQMPAVVRSVDAALRARHRQLSAIFTPLDKSMVGALASQSPRSLMKLLEGAYGVAAREALRKKTTGSRIRLTKRHLDAAASPGAAEPPDWDHDPGDGPLLVVTEHRQRVH